MNKVINQIEYDLRYDLKWSSLEKANYCVFPKKVLFFGQKKNLIQVLQNTLYFSSSIGRKE